MLARLIHTLKARGITAAMSAVTNGITDPNSDLLISSFVDTWISMSNIEHGGERNRGINVLKSRGMSHSNQVREFVLSESGIHISDVYSGPGGVLMGTARRQQELKDQLAGQQRADEAEVVASRTHHRLAAIDAQIAMLTAERAAEEASRRRLEISAQKQTEMRTTGTATIRRSRGGAIDEAGPE